MIPTSDYVRLSTLALRGHILVARVLLLVFPSKSVASVCYDVESFRCFPTSVLVVFGLRHFRLTKAASGPADARSPRSDNVVQFHLLAALPTATYL